MRRTLLRGSQFNQFHSAGLLDPHVAIPSVIALLVRLGIDPETDLELHLSIVQSLEALCNAGCIGQEKQRCETVGSFFFEAPIKSKSCYQEIAICQAVLAVALDLHPTSRSLLLSLFPGGTNLVKRIAQWIAYCLLTGDHIVS